MPDEAIAASDVIDSVLDTQNQPTTPEAPVTNDGQGDNQTQVTDDNGPMLRADYTRKTQELADQRRELEADQEQSKNIELLAQQAFIEGDEDALSSLLEAIGYEEPQVDQSGQQVDPEVANLKKQLDEISSWKTQQEQESEQRQQAMHIDTEIHRLTGEAWDRSNPDHESILAKAAFLSPPDGQLNIEAGHKAFTEERDRFIEAYKAGKYTTATNANLNGTPASAAIPDHADPEARASAIMERHGL